MTDKHVLNAILTTVKRWEDDPKYTDAEAMTDVARLIDKRGRGLDALAREWRARNRDWQVYESKRMGAWAHDRYRELR